MALDAFRFLIYKLKLCEKPAFGNGKRPFFMG